jgi:hypothetical protein
MVTHYEIEVSRGGTSQIVERIQIGKPMVQPDGMIRLDFMKDMASLTDGETYSASVIAAGPTGRAGSVATNSFRFSACKYRLSSPSTTVEAAGERAAVDVLTSGGLPCRWEVSGATPWLTITDAGSGVGSDTISFVASANHTQDARTATLRIGSLTHVIKQPAATAKTVLVATVEQLEAAVAAATSNTTIAIAPGTYRLKSTLRLQGNLTQVAIQGSTGRARDVVLEGPAREGNSFPVAIRVSGRVQAPTIADLTIRNAASHAILLDSGTDAPLLSNLHLVDAGHALVSASKVDFGVVENSVLESTASALQASSGGIDVQQGTSWTIRGNRFLNLNGPAGAVAPAAIVVSAGSKDTVVERNRFMNCFSGVAFGAGNPSGNAEHEGGLVVNNFFYRAASVPGGPAISIADAPRAQVVYNTIVTSGSWPVAIDYRYPLTTELLIANNLVDGEIKALDRAWAVEVGNVKNADVDLFVNASGGDLHLKRTAFAVLDVADVSISVATDIDGQPRPEGLAPDVGADEFSQSEMPAGADATVAAADAPAR